MTTAGTVPNSPKDVRDYYVHKAVGHLVTWMAGQANVALYREDCQVNCSDGLAFLVGNKRIAGKAGRLAPRAGNGGGESRADKRTASKHALSL